MLLLEVPEHILIRVLEHLRIHDIAHISLASKKLNLCAQNNRLWQVFSLRDLNVSDPVSDRDWRAYYEVRWKSRQVNGAIQKSPSLVGLESPSRDSGLSMLRAPNYLICGKYRMLNKLGSGSFGDIYAGINVEDNERIAIKLESVRSRHPQLHYESRVYKAVKGGVGIPNVKWFGVECDYSIMVMDLLGPSLEDYFNFCHRKFSLKTILMLAQQMLRLVEYLHTRNFIHRDIKPDNFVMGRGKKGPTVHMIDFGLAKKYRDSKTHEHLPYRTLKSLTGTPRYASINTHLGIEQSRRDDLESLAYVFLYFCRGSLPWQGLPAKNKKQKYQKITEKKVSTSVDQLCEGFPTEFGTFLTYTKNLHFTDKPDYDYLVKLFRDLFIKKGYKYDGIYDWTLKAKEAEQKAADSPPSPVPIACLLYTSPSPRDA
eukprot:TRINITY_DN303_c0_g1_i3.p1 TRINITY_DN303_c0_g1~~TRINITY_DN303_c0_g1_i3.p1  ORF type:complete len:427 (-),score=80.67 TRINITY_DN303_c0_g1_i3:16-1296(-)